MKKRILFGLLACVMAVCTVWLSACEKWNMGFLNDYAAANYDKISLKISTQYSDVTLYGKYEIQKDGSRYAINYSFDVLNEIEYVNGEYVVPDEAKSTYSGDMEVADGKIIKQNGTNINIKLGMVTLHSLKFEKSNFSAFELTDSEFSGTVSNVKGFLGVDMECSDMTVYVKYGIDKFLTMKINYTAAGGATVEMNYSFD